MRALTIVSAILVLFMVFPAVLFSAVEREDCHICGMWIDLYMKTRHVAVHRDGSRVSFCSIACTSKYLREHGGSVVKVMAADYLSRELIDARAAAYLSGSDVQGVMTYTSRIAFSSRQEAERFRKEHGGSVIDFQKALDELDEE